MAYTRNKAINGDVSIGGRYFANYGSAGIASPAIHASQIDEFNEGIALEVAKANSAARNAIISIAGSSSGGSSYTAGKGLVVGTESQLEVKAVAPLDFTSDGSLTLNLGTCIIKEGTGIAVNIGSGLKRDNSMNALDVNPGKGLQIDQNDGHKIAVKCSSPLAFDSDNNLTVRLSTGLMKDNSALSVKLGTGLIGDNMSGNIMVNVGNGLTVDKYGGPLKVKEYKGINVGENGVEVKCDGQTIYMANMDGGVLAVQLSTGLMTADNGVAVNIGQGLAFDASGAIQADIQTITSDTINALT